MGEIGQKNRRGPVEGQLVVRARIGDPFARIGRLQRGVIGRSVVERTEGRRLEQGIGPEVDPAQKRAESRAEFQKRLGVAYRLEIRRDGAFGDRGLQIFDHVIAASRRQRREHRLGGSNAGQHGVVRPLDARHVHEAGRTPHQRSTGKSQLRDGLPAARRHGAGAIADARAAFEQCSETRMGLEALHLVEGRQMGIGVVEMDHEADENLVVLGVIDKAPAAGVVGERPAEIVLDMPHFVPRRVDLPDFLDADAVVLRVRRGTKIEALDEGFGQRAARPSAIRV